MVADTLNCKLLTLSIDFETDINAYLIGVAAANEITHCLPPSSHVECVEAEGSNTEPIEVPDKTARRASLGHKTGGPLTGDIVNGSIEV